MCQSRSRSRCPAVRNFGAIFWPVAFALLVPGCSPNAARPTLPDGLVVEGIVIRNELPYPVSDVRILATKTGHFTACGLILAQSACRTSFAAIAYDTSGLVIRWKEHGKPQATGEFALNPPENLHANRPAWIEVLIFSPGEAGATFVQ